jgi:hypothetical protein
MFLPDSPIFIGLMIHPLGAPQQQPLHSEKENRLAGSSPTVTLPVEPRA